MTLSGFWALGWGDLDGGYRPFERGGSVRVTFATAKAKATFPFLLQTLKQFPPLLRCLLGSMIRELEFQLLCQRHSDDIFRYAHALLGNQADAEDAAQEVLLRLWNHLPRINLFNVRGWLFRTTRNYCLDQVRRRSHQSEGATAEEGIPDNWPDDFAVDPSFAADSSFRLKEARGALLKLPEMLRSVFVLYEVNGLRYREIAAALGIPINTVKVNLLRARRKLSKLVPKEEAWTTTCKD